MMQDNKRKRESEPVKQEGGSVDEGSGEQEMILSVDFTYYDLQDKFETAKESLSALHMCVMGFYNKEESRYEFTGHAQPLCRPHHIPWEVEDFIHMQFTMPFDYACDRTTYAPLMETFIEPKHMKGHKKAKDQFTVTVVSSLQFHLDPIPTNFTWIKMDHKWVLSKLAFCISKESWNKFMTSYLKQWSRINQRDKSNFLIE